MHYDQTIDYLITQLPMFQKIGSSAYKAGMDNSIDLDRHLCHPHRSYPTIHIAGTNGKGSTSHILAAILQSEGYKVGLYTSPHLLDFRERIRINGAFISKEYIVDFVAKHRHYFEPLYPSFFELTTAMAFAYFADQQVDIAVIEVGLGGRLDCTNVISPILSIVTNISLDHTHLLGSTHEAIAVEKAGIIKPDTPVVIGEAEATVKEIFIEKAAQNRAPIYFADQATQLTAGQLLTNGNRVFTLDSGEAIESELTGDYQSRNLATVWCALPIIKEKLTLSDRSILYGIAHTCELTGLMGRWQWLSYEPRIVCDTGHNQGGISYIAHQLAEQNYRQLHIVIGFVNDKEYQKVLSILPSEATYYFTQSSIDRALDGSILQIEAQQQQRYGAYYPTVSEAIEAAISQMSQDNDLLFIGGSTFIVADALALERFEQQKKIIV